MAKLGRQKLKEQHQRQRYKSCTVQDSNLTPTGDVILEVIQNNTAKEYELRNIPFDERPLVNSTQQAFNQIEALLSHYYSAPVSNAKTNNNRPDVVRKSFVTYLQHHFPHGQPYIHPITQAIYSNDLVRRRLFDFEQAENRTKRKIPNRDHSAHSLRDVQGSFCEYLRRDFTDGRPYQHPNKTLITNARIREVLEQYSDIFNGMCRLQHRALWALFTSQQSRAFITKNFNFNDNNVGRLWKDATDSLMWFLLYPELIPRESSGENYQALFCSVCLGTNATRSLVADYFMCSDSTIKRWWNDTVDILLSMLMYPEMTGERALYMYSSRG